MSDLCTIGDVELFLQIDISDSSDTSSCIRAIEEATAAIKSYCGQEIASGESTLDFDIWVPRRFILLPELPVNSVTSVVEDDEDLVEGRDEDYVLAQHGKLYRVGGFWSTGPQIVEVTWTHGYTQIPEDIVGVCARAASRAYQAGLKSASMDGLSGISARSLGDFSVQYHSERGEGASASYMLLESEKRILSRYKYE